MLETIFIYFTLTLYKAVTLLRMKRKLRKKALDRNYEFILQSEYCTFNIK